MVRGSERRRLVKIKGKKREITVRIEQEVLE